MEEGNLDFKKHLRYRRLENMSVRSLADISGKLHSAIPTEYSALPEVNNSHAMSL